MIFIKELVSTWRRRQQRKRNVWCVEHPGIAGLNGTWWFPPGRYAKGTYKDVLNAFGAFTSAGDVGHRIVCLEPEV